MLAIIGLAAKNAILIVEFAKSLSEQGMGLLEAPLLGLFFVSLFFVLIRQYFARAQTDTADDASFSGMVWPKI